ncbi:MAG TPA: LysR family transcriptional regulator [Pseudolabrys sp.]|jgi:DNA-binding transcriptional LysR family regulator
MLDGLTLDQLRTFIAAADEHSFSAAGRKLGRAQSVVSQTLANLEGQLGVKLFDRTGRYPILTDQGRVLLERARTVTGDLDLFKAHARSLASGLEPELSVAVDVTFPIGALTAVVADFQNEFPDTPLRLDVEALEAVIQPVFDRQSALGIMGSAPSMPPEFTSERLCTINLCIAVSPKHPLAQLGPVVSAAELAKYVQIKLTDRTNFYQGREFGLSSPKTWRILDLGTKHAFMRAGLGWGLMPKDFIADDLANGTLVELRADSLPAEGYPITMFAVYRTDTPPGPAGRWFIDRLRSQIISPACQVALEPSTALADVP